jgi:putative ABC transport system ATP-binding protein
MEQPTMADPAVCIRGARRVFSMRRGCVPVEALRGVDLVVEPGEFVALMGPSGSGKSTLLNLIGCIDTPSEGSVRILGREVSREQKANLATFRLRNLGFIFQRFNLISHLTALENAALPLEYLRPRPSARSRRERALGVLAELGLGERTGHRPEQLSGGEQQRVGIARAIVNEPQILLADEPTGELDSATGAEIVRVLAGLRERQGTTVVVVTHDPAIARQADRIVRLVDGRVSEDRVVDARDL